MFLRQKGHVDKVNEPFYSIALSTEVKCLGLFFSNTDPLSNVVGSHWTICVSFLSLEGWLHRGYQLHLHGGAATGGVCFVFHEVKVDLLGAVFLIQKKYLNQQMEPVIILCSSFTLKLKKEIAATHKEKQIILKKNIPWLFQPRFYICISWSFPTNFR